MRSTSAKDRIAELRAKVAAFDGRHRQAVALFGAGELAEGDVQTLAEALNRERAERKHRSEAAIRQFDAGVADDARDGEACADLARQAEAQAHTGGVK